MQVTVNFTRAILFNVKGLCLIKLTLLTQKHIYFKTFSQNKVLLKPKGVVITFTFLKPTRERFVFITIVLRLIDAAMAYSENIKREILLFRFLFNNLCAWRWERRKEGRKGGGSLLKEGLTRAKHYTTPSLGSPIVLLAWQTPAPEQTVDNKFDNGN